MIRLVSRTQSRRAGAIPSRTIDQGAVNLLQAAAQSDSVWDAPGPISSRGRGPAPKAIWVGRGKSRGDRFGRRRITQIPPIVDAWRNAPRAQPMRNRWPGKPPEAGRPSLGWTGAVEKTRTSTGFTPQRPQRCASTKFRHDRTVIGLVRAPYTCVSRMPSENPPPAATRRRRWPDGEGDRALDWIVSNEPVEYAGAVALMEARAGEIRAGTADEAVWLLEHPPLYTAGTSAAPADLVDPRFPVHEARRGGGYTYHGPGQRVVYVMFDLERRGRDLRGFVTALENWVIDTLGEFGIRGEIRPGRIGVWVARPEKPPLPDGTPREDKIAAIGLRVRKWVSFHGLSINVEPDLSHFDGIVPCGVTGHGVTSLVDLGLPVTMNDVDAALRRSLASQPRPLG